MSFLSVPSVEEVSNWKRAQVLTFLRSKKDELDLDDEDIDIVQKNKVAGRAFLNLTAEKLERWGMSGGPAETIVDLIKDIKGEREERGKRKAEGELTFAPKKRKWTVNSAITREERDIVYYADPTERNGPLLELIHRGEFVALYGPRASGKSTRVLAIQDQLQNGRYELQGQSERYICIYVTLEQVNIESVDTFWSTLGHHLYLDATQYSQLNTIKSADDFDMAFKKSDWRGRIVIFIDEFDKLYRASEDVKSSCLETLRAIKASKKNYAIWSVVAIGPFSILNLRSNNLTTSPFNVNDPFRNPNFTLEQVQFLYKQFADENGLTIDQHVIEDIYVQTNGHAGLVCLCGRAIFRKILSRLDEKRHISFSIWERFSMMSLGDEIIEYQTFLRMKDALLIDDTDTRRAMKLFRSNFLSNIEPVPVADDQMDLALFLTAEGVLVPGEEAGTFKISSPLVRWLILQRVIPKVFPSSPKIEVPYHSDSGGPNIFEILKQTIRTFDRESMKLACMRSFKKAYVNVNNVKNRSVPKESVYEAELYRILSNWLIGFKITGQWHIVRHNNGRNQHKYSDIVIDSPGYPTVVLELLATAKRNELDEHFSRVLIYANELSAEEVWIVHFTCEDDVTENPYWPGDNELKKGLRVVHFWHDINFTKIGVVACWWDANGNTKRITDVEEFMVSQ